MTALEREGVIMTVSPDLGRLQYTNLPANGGAVVLALQSGQPLRLRIVEVSHGLPDLAIRFRDRGDDMMENGVGDLTVVSRAYEF
jgi:hypothetical protein